MMEFRNAVFNAAGDVDCEVNHPALGWIPCTTRASDPLTSAIFAEASIVAAPYVAPDSAQLLEEWRASVSLSRSNFLLACVSAQILTEADAETAADGTWPSSFNTFISSLTLAEKLEARSTWAGAEFIRRSHPLISSLAASLSLTDQQLDALFGWTNV